MDYELSEVAKLRSRSRHFRQVATLVIFCLACLACLAPWLVAQEPARQQAPPPATDRFDQLAAESGECPPPSTQDKILIGLGSLAWAVILFLLLVRLMERRFIQSDRSATRGRHAGLSLTIFLSSLGLAAIAYLVTGCFHPELYLWLGFCGVVWIIHGIYTLIVARGE